MGTKTLTLTVDEYHDLSADLAGFCTSCGDIDYNGAVEPDAEGYECENCGETAVCGIEQGLLIGAVDVTD